MSDGTETADIAAHSWQIAGSVVLGGKADYKATEVDAPLDPFNGTWGAFELAFRYGELGIEDEVERLRRIGPQVKLLLKLPSGEPLTVTMPKNEVDGLGIQDGDHVLLDLRDAKVFVQDYVI